MWYYQPDPTRMAGSLSDPWAAVFGLWRLTVLKPRCTHSPAISGLLYPAPPLKSPPVAHGGLSWGGGRSPSDGLPGGGGGGARVFQGKMWYPAPPLQTPRLAHNGLPGGGGRRSPSDRFPGGGGDCKGISRQTVVPSTDASKENTCEATFALMRCQCVSCNTNVIEDPKER